MIACADTGQSAATVASPVAGIKDIVCIASGKGGVGKSTITVNLACALKAKGFSVGVLDADIHGPSVALLLGTGEGVEATPNGRAKPKMTHGIASLSVGNLLPPEAGLVWKGPLIAQAVEQLFHDVSWPDLDVLLVDLPPGTGDVQLTILERIAVTGAVIVSTPQRLAAVDAERGIALFHEFDIPVFGLIENMAGYICPCCGEAQNLFPTGSIEMLARKRHVAYLGAVPLDPAAQAAADNGAPLALADARSGAADAIHAIAARVATAIERESRMRRAASAMTDEDRAALGFWRELASDEGVSP